MGFKREEKLHQRTWSLALGDFELFSFAAGMQESSTASSIKEGLQYPLVDNSVTNKIKDPSIFRLKIQTPPGPDRELDDTTPYYTSTEDSRTRNLINIDNIHLYYTLVTSKPFEKSNDVAQRKQALPDT
ncbi:uncharacterized protein RAG0_13982 [Rhynchosporium agropyri]|uniref:Uncharacterized protein n=1 Tax=Rhynchosporium agropyri TaxID=914238 RepID=A0A1E1LF30_9HELO|nr:uncharacterized protein RAG0_13982 [Rhynchosporium agropyri]